MRSGKGGARGAPVRLSGAGRAFAAWLPRRLPRPGVALDGEVVEVAAEVFAPVDDPPERAGLDLVSERLRDYRFHTYWAGSLTSSGWPTRRSDPTPGWPHSVERPHAGRSTVRRPAHRTASKPRMSADARLSGNGRLRAYAELDCDVARAAVLAVPFACARPASSSPLAWAAKCRIRSTGSTWPPCASAGVDLVVPLAITVALGRPGPRRRRPRCSAMVPALTARVGLSATPPGSPDHRRSFRRRPPRSGSLRALVRGSAATRMRGPRRTWRPAPCRRCWRGCRRCARVRDPGR